MLEDAQLRALLVDYLQRLIRSIPSGVHLSSWHRTARENAAAGGHPHSQHLYSLATDWTGPPAALTRTAFLAEGNGLFAVVESDHVHVQRFPAGLLAQAGLPFPPRFA